MSPASGRAFILVVSKREALASAMREHVPTSLADIQSVGGPEEARRYAQRHSPSLVVVDGESSQGMWIVDRIREEPTLTGVTLMVLSAEPASTRMIEHWFSERPADLYARLPLSAAFYSSEIRPLLVAVPAAGSVSATEDTSDSEAASSEGLSPAQRKKIEAAKRGIEKALKAAKTFKAERDRALTRLQRAQSDIQGAQRDAEQARNALATLEKARQQAQLSASKAQDEARRARQEAEEARTQATQAQSQASEVQAVARAGEASSAQTQRLKKQLLEVLGELKKARTDANEAHAELSRAQARLRDAEGEAGERSEESALPSQPSMSLRDDWRRLKKSWSRPAAK